MRHIIGSLFAIAIAGSRRHRGHHGLAQCARAHRTCGGCRSATAPPGQSLTPPAEIPDATAAPEGAEACAAGSGARGRRRRGWRRARLPRKPAAEGENAGRGRQGSLRGHRARRPAARSAIRRRFEREFPHEHLTTSTMYGLHFDHHTLSIARDGELLANEPLAVETAAARAALRPRRACGCAWPAR